MCQDYLFLLFARSGKSSLITCIYMGSFFLPRSDCGPMTDQKRPLSGASIVAVCFAAFVVIVYLAVKFGDPDVRSPPPSGAPPAQAAAPPPGQPVVAQVVEAPKSDIDRILEYSDPGDALVFARARMGDTTDGPSQGAALLALWLDANGKWEHFEPKRDETSVGKVKKDSLSELGRRMCARGRVIQIHKERAGRTSFFTGNLVTEAGNIINFVAVGSTGELVEDSRARFCGSSAETMHSKTCPEARHKACRWSEPSISLRTARRGDHLPAWAGHGVAFRSHVHRQGWLGRGRSTGFYARDRFTRRAHRRVRACSSSRATRSLRVACATVGSDGLRAAKGEPSDAALGRRARTGARARC